MVKPPKSMQPEAVDLDEIKKKGTRGMGGDDFRNYMARKIDLQRQQFGVVLPPDPREARERHVRFADNVHPPVTKKRRVVDDMSSLIKTLKKRHGNTKRRKRSGSAREAQSEERAIAKLPQDSINDAESPMDLSQDRDRRLSSRSNAFSDCGKATSSALGTKASPSSRRAHRPDLFFRGVVVLVNGYTVPDTETLMRLLHKHGGDLEKYETTRVTHIIAQNLSTAKANMYKRQRQPKPVCRPEWIVDSVSAGKLLPCGDYLIKEVQLEATSSVKKFFAPQAHIAQRDALNGCTKVDRDPTHESGSREGEIDTLLEGGKDSRSNAIGSQDLDGGIELCSAPSVVSDEDPLHGDKRHLQEGNISNITNSTAVASDTKELNKLPSETPSEDANGITRVTHEAVAVEKASARAQHNSTSFPDGRTRTVGTDPNFLESYFNSSRLSFIGSFKQRARQSPTKRAAKKSAASKRFVFLVDMDSFFASVVLRNFPEYRDKPVAISHMGKQPLGRGTSANPTSIGSKDSTSECATCNYEARKYGIKKGMFLGRARELCSQLVVLPYDFEGYEEVSEQVADILYRVAGAHEGTVEQVSCDESYVELFLSTVDDIKSADELALTIAEGIREEVFVTTQCTATVGVASNKLLAKLAADQVKPNKCMVVDDHRRLLQPLNLRDLHGIGYRMEKKLVEENLVSVLDVWELGDHAESELVRILGPGLGKKIASFCKGQDDRQVKPAERKTIGAECNYGVRFDGPYGVEYMVEGLAKEVQKRMKSVGVKGSRVTLKVKQRKQGAKPPPKFLGHGSCHNLSKSAETLGSVPTNESQVISRISLQLLQELDAPTSDIRGMGIVVSKLSDENATRDLADDTSGRITSWFAQSTAKSASHGCSLLDAFDSAPGTSSDVPGTSSANVESRSAENVAILGLIDEKANGTTLVNTAKKASVQEIINSECSNKVEPAEDADGRDLQASSILSPPTSEPLSQEEITRSTPNDAIDWKDDDIELPSFSQIHMSQVAELPRPMRESIMARVSIGQDDRCIDVSADDDEKAQGDCVGIGTRETDEGGAMRQISLKRMMKLAAVKSGQDTSLSESLGGSISLTQLECLPLEMQLQIANNEDLDSSSSTRKKPLQSNSRESSSPIHKKMLSGNQPEGSHRDEPNGRQEGSAGKSAAESMSFLISEQPSFYHENIVPLKSFMDSNPRAEGAATQTVQEFLLICVKEGRLTDAVKLLRSIKNRGDAWSRVAYRDIVSVVDEQVRLSIGVPLDLCGLGLQGKGS